MAMRKPSSISVALLALLAGGFFALRYVRGVALDVQPVRRATIVQHVLVSGRVLPPARVNLGSLAAGRVAKVNVREGQSVTADAALIVLDDAEARAALAQAESGLLQAKARLDLTRTVSVALAREVHRQADAVVESAELHFARTRALLQSGSVSQSELDEATRALTVARAQHDSAEAQDKSLGARGADHTLALATYAQAAANVALAQVHVDQLTLRAPGPVLVLNREAEPGDVVQPGQTLLILARIGSAQLQIEPDEKNLAVLHIGQKARASADAFADQVFEADVSYIAPSVDPQRGTIEVRLDVPSPPAYLRPDMTVSVDLEVGRKDNALVVPTEAIHELAAEHVSAFVLQDGRLARRELTLGLRGDGVAEATGGVGEHELVVVQATGALRDGQRAHARATGAH